MANKKQIISTLLKNIARNTKYGKMLEVLKASKEYIRESPLGKTISEGYKSGGIKGVAKAVAESQKEATAKQPEWMKVAQTIPIGFVVNVPAVRADIAENLLKTEHFQGLRNIVGFYGGDTRFLQQAMDSIKDDLRVRGIRATDQRAFSILKRMIKDFMEMPNTPVETRIYSEPALNVLHLLESLVKK